MPHKLHSVADTVHNASHSQEQGCIYQTVVGAGGELSRLNKTADPSLDTKVCKGVNSY